LRIPWAFSSRYCNDIRKQLLSHAPEIEPTRSEARVVCASLGNKRCQKYPPNTLFVEIDVTCFRLLQHIKRKIQTLSYNRCCCGKAVSSTCSGCVSLALFGQHAKRMTPIMSSSVACPALTYFSTLSHRRHDLKKKHTHTQVCV